MVSLNDLVKQGGKCVNAFVAAAVDTDARVGPFATREDNLLESVAKFVPAIFASFPDITSKGLRKERLGSAGEVRELSDLRGC